MKGCPEGGEQMFLFSLYSQLSSPTCSCPQDCGAAIPRSKGDFFALHVSPDCPFDTTNVQSRFAQPDFSAYIDRLRSKVTKICPRCHSKVCLACGEPVSVDAEKHSATREDPLFHCADLQGVILGVGLTMLDDIFNQHNQDTTTQPADSTTSSRNNKRQKPNTSLPLEADDGDALYYSNNAGKRAKGGIGYAGDGVEDVRPFIGTCSIFIGC